MPKQKAQKAQAPAKASATLSSAAAASNQPPNWPPFKPALPVVELTLKPIFDSFEDKIQIIENFWPKSLCQSYVHFLSSLPLATTPGRPKKGEAVRVNDRFQINDSRFAQRLWTETGLREVVLSEDNQHLWGGEVVGLNPNIRIYRYSKGQYFACHYDDANMVDIQPSSEPTTLIPSQTTWTILLYLTSAADGCLGGETVFYPKDRQVAKEEMPVSLETGMLLLHKHGQDCLLHEGREVLQGDKWVIRSDLAVRR